MGVPPNHPFIDGFSKINHPAIGGIPMTLETTWNHHDDPIKFRQNLCGEQLQPPSDSPTFAWKANGAWTAAFGRLPSIDGRWFFFDRGVHGQKWGGYRDTANMVICFKCGYHMIEWDMDGLTSYDWKVSIKCRDFANMGWAPKLCTSISGQSPFMTHFRQS